MSFSFQPPPIIVVFHFCDTTVFAVPKSLTVAFSSFIPSSEVIIFAPVSIAISFNISFFLSPNQGDLIPSIFNTHFSLFKMMVVRASASISSAIITRSFFPSPRICSKSGTISFIEEILPSVIRILASRNSLTIFSPLVTIYGEIYHCSNSIHSVTSNSNQKVCHSSTEITPLFPTFSIAFAMIFPTSLS